MDKKNVIRLVKKLTASVLAVGMVLSGIVVAPKQADAAVVVDRVIYEEYTASDITKYWTADSKTAPVKEGYVFGGWFEEADPSADNVEELVAENGQATKYCVPLTEEDLKAGVPDSAYAKFVPAQVLSVKAQNERKVSVDYIENFVDEQDSFYVRVMSSLDSKNYQKVGFDIWLANAVQVLKKEEGDTEGKPLETTRIYTGLKEGEATKTANEIFGGVSQYLSVWQLTKINYKSNVNKIIYVRPYWITKDGTKVEGLAKYVHIEDEYMNYISVPVNLLSAEKVAAGAVNMIYDNEALEFAGMEAVSFETGRLLPEMSFYHDTTNKTIRMVGNATTVGEYNSGESIFANIRFKKPSADANFNMELVQFCDWTESEIAKEKVKVWDITYDVQ